MHPDPRAPHFVVCGDDNLAYRLTRELVLNHGAEVTVILRPDSRDSGERIATIPGVRLVLRHQRDREAFERAGLAGADAVALVEQDDGGNVDAALVAREVAPDVRIVMRIFDETLAASMHDLL